MRCNSSSAWGDVVLATTTPCAHVVQATGPIHRGEGHTKGWCYAVLLLVRGGMWCAAGMWGREELMEGWSRDEIEVGEMISGSGEVWKCSYRGHLGAVKRMGCS